jgi:DNA-binding CsgD family transcriptional regulator
MERRYAMAALREQLPDTSNAAIAMRYGVSRSTVAHWRVLLDLPPAHGHRHLQEFLLLLLTLGEGALRGAALARTLGISRQAVNEALRRLQEKGYAEKRGTGTSNIVWHSRGKEGHL